MNLGLNYLMEEIISACLEANGVSDEIRHKVMEEIEISCKEINNLHNEVANSNYYAAQEREENQRVIKAEKSKDELEEYYRDMIKELEYTIRVKENRISDLLYQLHNT